MLANAANEISLTRINQRFTKSSRESPDPFSPCASDAIHFVPWKQGAGLWDNKTQIPGQSTLPPWLASLVDDLLPVSYVEIQGSCWRFVPGFSTIAAPLHAMTKQGASKDLVWTKEAMETLKKEITTAPVLISADVTKPYILQTDASDIGLGARTRMGLSTHNLFLS